MCVRTIETVIFDTINVFIDYNCFVFSKFFVFLHTTHTPFRLYWVNYKILVL